MQQFKARLERVDAKFERFNIDAEGKRRGRSRR